MEAKGEIKTEAAAGIYHLLLCLRRPRKLRVGRLGIHDFPAGHYVYTGRARRGLDGRLARHMRKRKTRHWHIDYLTAVADIKEIRVNKSNEECRSHRAVMKLPGAQVIVPGFGSSDCRCPSHLAHFERRPKISGSKCAIARKRAP
jgi:sugar fermentation stimulation protein A